MLNGSLAGFKEVVPEVAKRASASAQLRKVLHFS